MNEDPGRWSIRRLDGEVDTSDFDSGDEPWGRSITDFLINDALEQQKWLMSKAMLFYNDDSLLGYVTLAASLLEISQAGRVRRQPGLALIGRDSIPSVLIARFGIHKDHQRKGYGNRMFSWA